MDSNEITARVKAFIASIRAGRITLARVNTTVRGWVAPGFITTAQADTLLAQVAALADGIIADALAV